MYEQVCKYLVPELDPRNWDPKAVPKYTAVCHNRQSGHFGEMVYESWPKDACFSAACEHCTRREPS